MMLQLVVLSTSWQYEQVKEKYSCSFFYISFTALNHSVSLRIPTHSSELNDADTYNGHTYNRNWRASLKSKKRPGDVYYLVLSENFEHGTEMNKSYFKRFKVFTYGHNWWVWLKRYIKSLRYFYHVVFYEDFGRGLGSHLDQHLQTRKYVGLC